MRPDGDSGSCVGRLGTLLMRMALFRVIRQFIFVQAKRAIMKREATVDSASLSNYRPDAFEQNLRSMVALARERRIKIIFLTLTTIVGPDLSQAGLERVHLPFFINSVGDFAALVSAYN